MDRVSTWLGRRRETAWSSTSELPPVLDILAVGDRVIAVREPDADREQLVDVLDDAGARQCTIRGRRGPWTIDPRGPMLLGSSPTGEPSAWSLAEPAAEPILWSTRFNGRDLCELRMLDDFLLAAAVEPQRLGGPPPSVFVAAIRIPDWDDVSRWGTLRGTTRVAERVAGDITHFVLGVEPAGPILATDDHVCWTDWSLQPRAELDLEGHPLLASARSDARIWMLALHGDEPELRILAPGRCEARVPVHAAFGPAERLLVTPDDGAILVAPTRIQSFDAQGGFRWKLARQGAARALVDTTGTILFTHGSALIEASPDGACREVWTAPPPTPSLGPMALLGDDRLVVASGPDLFALAPSAR
jgi:hypothetical protein